MGCRSDYLEQTGKERGLQRASHLLNYTIGELARRGSDHQVPATALSEQGAKYYAEDVGQVEALCALLKSMSSEDVDAIVYNARSEMSRELATWWETHQAADRAREAKEQADIRNAALRQQALAKLTDEEREALGV